MSESTQTPEPQVSETDEAQVSSTGSRVQALENEGEIAADYLEELLDIADLDGDLDMDVEGDRAAVSIVGAELSQLVGRDGEVLDVSGFRAARRAELEKIATEAVERCKESGSKISLDAMSPFERKVVHDAVAAAGLVSESEGVEPRRFVVILPE